MVKLAFDPADLVDISDPREMPSYTVPEVAWSLRMPPSTVRSWFFGNKDQFAALLLPALPESKLLSFNNMIETFVLRSLRKGHKIPMHHVRQVLERVEIELGRARPLLHEDFKTDGIRLFIEHAGITQDAATGQRALFEEHLKRLNFRDGVANRIYPYTRPGSSCDDPMSVVIDATRSFGRPIVDRIGVPTEVINDRWWAGDSISMLTEDYCCEAVDIEEAIKYESDRRAA